MEIERIDLPERAYLYVERECPYGPEIAEAMGSGFGELFGFIGQHGIAPLSMPMSIYHGIDPAILRFQSAAIVSAADAERAQGTIKRGVLAAGPALKIVHVGSYDTMNKSHEALWAHIKAQGIEGRMPTWEHYIDDPTEVDVSALRTEIFLPLA